MKGQLLYKRAKKIIPGGTQLLSKRPEMFLPGSWPSYYLRCKGDKVWDLDNIKYIDFTINGVGACTLGYADPDVDLAVENAIKRGNMCTLNVPEEIDLAELLCEIHPWAKMVRYARGGGEAMAIAVRIIRAYSGKEKILFCGYHGWHDWYLSANLSESSALDGQLLPGLQPKGVPRGLQGTAIPFYYNDIKGFKSLIKKYNGQIAGIIMEPVRNYWPSKGFIEEIRQLTIDKKIPLVFDEITSGLRMTNGGIHLKLKIVPDIAVFAKALGNGYPMAAVIGRAEIMNSAQKTFISSTYWTDRIGPCAALATLKKYKKYNVSEHLIRIGILVQDGWKKLGEECRIKIHVSGIPPLSHWQIEEKDSEIIHTYIIKKMLEEGFLTSKAFYSTFSHTEVQVRQYLLSLNKVLKEIVPYIKKGTISKICHDRIAHSGFVRIN